MVDESEQLAIERVKELYGAEWANVQPHWAHRPTRASSGLHASGETPS